MCCVYGWGERLTIYIQLSTHSKAESQIKGIERCELEARNVKRRMEVKAICQKGETEKKER